MKTRIMNFLFLLLTGLAIGQTEQWSQWRGPLGTGVSPTGTPPITWSEDSNIRWKVVIPGSGISTPVVWDNQIFVTTAIAVGDLTPAPGNNEEMTKDTPEGTRKDDAEPAEPEQAFTLFSLDKSDGKVLWKKILRRGSPHEGTHADGTWASSSPVTDGNLVYAYFGSNGLYCLDLEGNLKWDLDLGDMHVRRSFGEGSSPCLYGDRLIVNWDHEGDSFIVALDKMNGREIWRKARSEITSWSTPIVVNFSGTDQVIVSATGKTRSYDLRNGDLIWESSGMTVNVVPSPVYGNGMVYVMSGFRGSALQAIDLSKAKGDISDTDAIAWKWDQDTPYVPSPLLYDNRLFFMKVNQGTLTCLNAVSGQKLFGPERLKEPNYLYASPVGANGHVYLTGRNGKTLVIKNADEFQVVAENPLDDQFDASAVVSGDTLLLRGRKSLYCIGKK